MSMTAGRQSISCDVNNCAYNDGERSCCGLRSIQVCSKPGGGDAMPGGGSMCASFKSGG